MKISLQSCDIEVTFEGLASLGADHYAINPTTKDILNVALVCIPRRAPSSRTACGVM